MKHLKIYEQYDFEDLSNEELFGKEETEIMCIIKMSNFYIVEKMSHEDGKIYLYNNYEWIDIEEYDYFKNRLISLKDVPINSLINIYDKERKIDGDPWVEVRKENLPEEIKKRLK